jgi:uridine monophosphate synthetase
MTFAEKLDAAIQCRNSLLCLGLDPNPEMLPTDWRDRTSSQIAAYQYWLESVIAETQDWVCAYKPTLGFYLALGAEGLELLGQLLSSIPADIPVILDAKFSDLNTATVLADTLFKQWRVDAVTVNPYVGQEGVTPFLLYPDRAVFVLAHTSNPSASAIQSHPTAEAPRYAPLYLEVVKAARNWGSAEQVCLEVGTSDLQVLSQIRALAPERTILARSIWTETNLQSILEAGLNQSGTGLLLPVPQDWLSEPSLSTQVQTLRSAVNDLRAELFQGPTSCEVRLPVVELDLHNSNQDLILQLYDIGCLMFGEYVQASGAVFPYYIDLRRIISNPQLFHRVLDSYARILKPLTFDRIAGIPYGSLPTATGLALKLNRPMIYPRKEVKAHGTRRLVEGEYKSGETAVVVDDVLITGKSVLEGVGKLETSGLNVTDIVILIDHGVGVRDRVSTLGYQTHAILTLSEIGQTLYQAQRIDEVQYKKLSPLKLK